MALPLFVSPANGEMETQILLGPTTSGVTIQPPVVATAAPATSTIDGSRITNPASGLQIGFASNVARDTTGNTYYGALLNFFSTQDFSPSLRKQLIFHKYNTNNTTNGTFRVTLFSGTPGTYTNRRTWTYARKPTDGFIPSTPGEQNTGGLGNSVWRPISLDPNSPGTDVGTFDPATIHAIEFSFNTPGIASNIWNERITWIYSSNSPTFVQGDAVNFGTFSYLVYGIALPYGYGIFGQRARHAYAIGEGSNLFMVPIQIGNSAQLAYFKQLDFSVEFYPRQTDVNVRTLIASDSHLGLRFNLIAGSYCELTRGRITGNQPWALVANSTGANIPIQINEVTFVQASPVTLSSDWTQVGGSFINCGEVTANGGAIRNVSIVNATDSGLLLSTTSTLTGLSIRNCVTGCRVTTAGNYSANTAALSNNTRDVLITAGVTDGQSVNLSGLSFPDGSTTTTNIRWEGTSGTVNVNVGKTGLTTSTAGGTINLITPLVRVNMPNVATGTRVRISRVSNGAELFNGLSTGSDFGVALTEVSGTAVRVQAQYQAGSGAGAVASIYFERDYTWNGVTSIDIQDVVGSTNPDAIYNTITASEQFSGTVFTGLSYTSSEALLLQVKAGDRNTLFTQEAYLYFVNQRATEDGIRRLRNQFKAVDLGNFTFSTDLQIDNTSDGTRFTPATQLRVRGSFLRRENGSSWIATGSGTVYTDFASNAIAYTVGSGLTNSQATQLTAAAAAAAKLDPLVEVAASANGTGNRFTLKALELAATGLDLESIADAVDDKLATKLNVLPQLEKRQGLVSGVSVTQKDPSTSEGGFLVSSDGSINQTISLNSDGTITISST